MRSRFVVRQFREGTNPRVHAGVPGSAAVKILLTLAAVHSLFAATADFSVAFMHSPTTRSFRGASTGGKSAQRISVAGAASTLRAMHTWGACLKTQGSGAARELRPSTTERRDGVRMSVRVDDPLVIGPEGPIRVLFEWKGQRDAVKCLETFDPVRGLKPKVLGNWVLPHSKKLPGDESSRMASMMGVLHAKTPARNPQKAPDGGRREAS